MKNLGVLLFSTLLLFLFSPVSAQENQVLTNAVNENPSASPEVSATPAESVKDTLPATVQQSLPEEAPGVTAQPAIIDKSDDNLISVNFQDADIKQVLNVIEVLTGKVIIPPDDLQGTITIESLEKVSPEVVISILESTLMVKGYTLIESDNTFKIVPLPDTKQTNVAVNVGTSPDDIKETDVVITQVMTLKYASANTLKTILQPLVGKHGNILANDSTNTLIITDLSANIKRLAKIIAEVERPQPANIQVKTFTLNYGDAEKIAKILTDLSKEKTEAPIPLPEEIQALGGKPEIYGTVEAFSDKETSSIVVASAPINFPTIDRLIKELDVFPPQAMIEVIIMDVTLGDDFSMGIDYSDATNPTSTTEGIKFDADNSGFKESIIHSLLGLATDAATSGFTYRILNSSETIQALAFILSSQENSKVISTPKILASNNLESSITVGQEIPIVESSTTDLANNVTNVDYRYQDVGLILKVTPRISRDGYTNLKVHAQLSDLSPQTIINAPVINKREADANVIIPDGQTVVLGGLMRDNDSVVENKIPFLGDIPIFGLLFKKTETVLLKTELLIFLTPYIIKNSEDLAKVTAASHNKLISIQGVSQPEELKKTVKKVVNYQKHKSKPKKQPARTAKQNFTAKDNDSK
jgi:type II secretory pathway component GspD/PulD (secretin)